MRMDWLSILIIVILGFVTWRAYANGFIRELVSLSAVILAVPLAGIFYDNMFPKVEPIVRNDNLAYLVSFLSILIGVIVGGQVVAHLLKQTVAILNLGAADHVAGGLFGFLKAVIVCQVVLIALVHFPEPDLRDEIDGSPAATGLLDYAPLPLAILPGHFHDTVNGFLHGVNELAGNVPTTPTPVAQSE